MKTTINKSRKGTTITFKAGKGEDIRNFLPGLFAEPPRTIEIDGMHVPSLGKYEAEWALRKLMGDPMLAKGYLIDAIMTNFQECREEALKFANAAFAKHAEMTGSKT